MLGGILDLRSLFELLHSFTCPTSSPSLAGEAAAGMARFEMRQLRLVSSAPINGHPQLVPQWPAALALVSSVDVGILS